jgi:hypothetical protein
MSEDAPELTAELVVNGVVPSDWLSGWLACAREVEVLPPRLRYLVKRCH